MMQCPMCRTKKPNWENVDQYRHKPEEMSLCLDCGFISYPNRYKTKKEIIEYYKKEYRSVPNIKNLYTGQRKLHYHQKMLDPVFESWKAKNLNNPVVSDVGAAFGMCLNWIKHQFPEADVNGVELTQSYVRNAWHLYNIKLDEDFNDNKKYDLIVSYKSLEHILDPDVELKRYINSLKDDGILYLSVPIWFRKMCNFGVGGWNIDYYYSPNHINVWNLEQFEELIKICGGEIVETDHVIYESTYKIKKSSNFKKMDRSSIKQDIKKIKGNLTKIYEANEAYELADFSRAIEIWPNFPTAHKAFYEINRKKFHEAGFDFIYKKVLAPAVESCQDDPEMHYLAAEVSMRYNQFEKTMEHCMKCQDLRPNMPQVYMLLSNVHRSLAKLSTNDEDKVKHTYQAVYASKALRDYSQECRSEATTWIMYDNSNLPTPHEET